MDGKVENKRNVLHGTVLLRTDRLTLRPHLPEDAEVLFQAIGRDKEMFRYTGWSPYATEEMANATVQRFIAGYEDPHFYGWAICLDDKLIGTIGAYDFENDSIEVGFSIQKSYWGKGFGSDALKAVRDYLTENENIPRLTAWCASENIGSRKVLENAGFYLRSTEMNAIEVDDRIYDKLNYEYKK